MRLPMSAVRPRPNSNPRPRPRWLPEIQSLEDRNAPDNLAPIAFGDLFSFDEDTLLNVSAPGVLANDTDGDNDPLTAELVDGPTSGQLAFNADGSFTYDPEENYNGTVTFTYHVFDGTDWSNVAMVTLTINPVNDAPFAADDNVPTYLNNPVTFSPLDNDFDVEGDSLSIVDYTAPSHGTLEQNQGGSFMYTPAAGWEGEDSFTYTVADFWGATDSATVAIHSVDDTLTANDDQGFTNEEEPVTINVLANDEALDPDSLSVIDVNGPGHGSILLNADNTVTYTPDVDWFGEDSFTYTVHDDLSDETDMAAVWLTIYPMNDAPDAINDGRTISEEGSITFNVLDNDIDVENPDLGVLVNQPAHGTVEYELTGEVTYRPYVDFTGVDQFTYLAFDDSGGQDTATVTIMVEPVNDVPIAYNDLYPFGMPRDVPPPTFTGGSLLGNDIDYDYNDPSYVYSLQVTSVVTPPDFQGTLQVSPNGFFDYTPPMNFFETTSFTYQTTDGLPGSLSEPATVWLLVSEQLASPGGDPLPPVVARDDLYEYDAQTESISGNVLSNDDNATYAILGAPPAYGRLIPFAGGGSFTYYPDADRDGNPVPGVNLSSGPPAFTASGIPYTAYTKDRTPGLATLVLQKQQEEVKVDKIEFRQYCDRTYFQLEDNPSYPDAEHPGGVTPGGGKRVFSDLEKDTDKNAEARSTVWVKVTLSPAKAGIIPVIWAYDVDDPSADRAPLDKDGVGGDPLQEFDNRDPDERSRFAPDRHWKRLVPEEPSDAKGVAWVALPVSRQPGDNYRVVASMTEAAQAGFKPLHPDPAKKGTVVDANGQDAATHTDVKVSDLLTVWRRLNIEQDHMGAPKSNDVFDGVGAGDGTGNGDDDKPPVGPQLDPSLAFMEKTYHRAYVEVRKVPDARNKVREVTFQHNLGVGLMAGKKNRPYWRDWVRGARNVESLRTFWVIQMVGAYEGPVDVDYDPPIGDTLPAGMKMEQALTGQTVTKYGNWVPYDDYADGPSYIFLETIRDRRAYRGEARPDPSVTYQPGDLYLIQITEQQLVERTVNHESGHHFGLQHPPPRKENRKDVTPMNGYTNQFGTDEENMFRNPELNSIREAERPA